jgi:hypothetical protein
MQAPTSFVCPYWKAKIDCANKLFLGLMLGNFLYGNQLKLEVHGFMSFKPYDLNKFLVKIRFS